MVPQVQCPNCRSYYVSDSITRVDRRTGKAVAPPVIVFLIAAFLGLIAGCAMGTFVIRTILRMDGDSNILVYVIALFGIGAGVLVAYQRTNADERAASVWHRFTCNTCRYMWNWQER